MLNVRSKLAGIRNFLKLMLREETKKFAQVLFSLNVIQKYL